MKKITLGIATALLTLGPLDATASFLRNYTEWKKLTSSQKVAFIAGVWDGWLTPTQNEEPWQAARRDGLSNCVKSQEFTGQMLVDLVNNHYKEHKADWRVEPAVVFQESIQGVCLLDINKSLSASGLATWERHPEQITKDAP